MKKKIVKKKILLVDDNEEDVSFLKELLVKNNYEVITANSGIDALYLLKHKQIDVLITDILVPEITGVEVIKTLQGVLFKKPTVFIVSSASDFFAKEIYQLPVSKIFTKPFQEERLLKSLELYLKL